MCTFNITTQLDVHISTFGSGHSAQARMTVVIFVTILRLTSAIYVDTQKLVHIPTFSSVLITFQATAFTSAYQNTPPIWSTSCVVHITVKFGGILPPVEDLHQTVVCFTAKLWSWTYLNAVLVGWKSYFLVEVFYLWQEVSKLATYYYAEVAQFSSLTLILSSTDTENSNNDV